MSSPPPRMKFGELMSGFRGSAVREVLTSDRWIEPYGRWFDDYYTDFLPGQNRDVMDSLVPLDLSRAVVERFPCPFFYDPSIETLRTHYPYGHGPLVELTALDVHDLYGGATINAVMARGGAKVPPPPEGRGRAVASQSGPMSREEARECGPLFYVPSYKNLRDDRVWYADGVYDGRLTELTALDVYDLYGPGIIEEVQEYGSANVPPPPEGRGRAFMRPPIPPPEPPPPPPRHVGRTDLQIATRKARDERDNERLIPLLEETIRANSRDWHARDMLANALAAVGRVSEAVPLWLEIADWYAKDGFHTVARGKLRIVQRLSPDHPGIAPRLAALQGKGE